MIKWFLISITAAFLCIVFETVVNIIDYQRAKRDLEK